MDTLPSSSNAYPESKSSIELLGCWLEAPLDLPRRFRLLPFQIYVVSVLLSSITCP